MESRLDANYFDNAATTPADPLVVQEMRPFFCTDFGNASSLHSWGRSANAAVELARERVARATGFAPEEVVFTSGATESNCWVVNEFQLAVSPFEHSSVFGPAILRDAEVLKSQGWDVLAPEGSPDCVSVMHVNNETGAILTPKLGDCGLLHVDAVQSLCKVEIDPQNWDLASFCAHKLGGPKGVGALCARGHVPIGPENFPGHHERGLRSGTLNVAGIVGFGAACELGLERMSADRSLATELRSIVLEGLRAVSDMRLNDHSENSPFILSVSFSGIVGESVVVELDTKGFAVSSGAACSEGSREDNRVLECAGTPADLAAGTVRVSFWRQNTPESARALGRELAKTVESLRSLAI